MISLNEEKNFAKSNSLFTKMAGKPISVKGNVVEYTKKLDNKILGIIKENSLYTIKIANKKQGQLVSEDFEYINGYESRKKFQRKTLQEAIKYLHLFLNEDQYVLDVPVAMPQTPAPQMPPMDNPQDAPVDGEMPADDATGDAGEGEAPSNDDQQEIQKLTGTLAQDLRQEIQGDGENFTVGMFKSILAAAKDLSDTNKEELMNKAEEVLTPQEGENGENTDNSKGEEGQQNTNQPNNQNQDQMNNNIQEARRYDFDDLSQVAALSTAKSPKVILDMLVSKFTTLPNCVDYKTIIDNKHCGVRFVTEGKYDLFVFYFATVEIENYDVFVVSKKHIFDFFDNIDNYEKVQQFIQNDKLNANFHEIDLVVQQFLSDPTKPEKGNLSASKEKVEESTAKMTKKELFESLGIYKTQSK